MGTISNRKTPLFSRELPALSNGIGVSTIFKKFKYKFPNYDVILSNLGLLLNILSEINTTKVSPKTEAFYKFNFTKKFNSLC